MMRLRLQYTAIPGYTGLSAIRNIPAPTKRPSAAQPHAGKKPSRPSGRIVEEPSFFGSTLEKTRLSRSQGNEKISRVIRNSRARNAKRRNRSRSFRTSLRSFCLSLA